MRLKTSCKTNGQGSNDDWVHADCIVNYLRKREALLNEPQEAVLNDSRI